MRYLATLARCILLSALVLVPFAGTVGVAHAAANSQEGDNRSMTDQSGDGTSGDSVAGQVAGVVSGGNTSVDATNATDHSDASSGDARGTNTSSTITGPNAISGCSSLTVDTCTADLFSPGAIANGQEGDNRSQTNQSANTTSGSAVAGEVVGVVTSAGGSADVVLANSSTFVDISSGDSRFDNSTNTIVGPEMTGGPCCSLPDTLGPVASTSLDL